MQIDELPGSRLLESADDGAGWRWRVQVIQAGLSRNRTDYPLELLTRRAGLYEAAPVFAGRGADHNLQERGFGSQVGWIVAPRANDQGVEATFVVRRDRDDVRQALLHGWEIAQETGRPSFGFSHVIPPGHFRATVQRLAEGQLVRRVEDFDAVESVDLVMRPAAGGTLLGLAAAEGRDEELDAMDELLERLRRGETLTDEERETLMRSVTADVYLAAVAAGDQARAAAEPPPAPTEPAPTLAAPAAVTEALTEAVDLRLGMLERRLALREALATANLPQPMAEAVNADFEARLANGDLFDPAEITRRISRDRAMAARLVEAAGQGQPGTTLRVTADDRDRRQKALDGLFMGHAIDGVPPYRSIKTAFKDITGSTLEHIDSRLPFAILAESIGFAPADMRLTEAVTTGTWAEMLGDSMTRRMIAEYSAPNLSTWRMITGDPVPLSDFRTQRRVRMGGYGDLPTVLEAGTYQPVATPPDEEASYAPSKRGGLEYLTMEAIANDDIGAVRQIPIRLGRAAARTLYHAVWVDTIVGNPVTSYDSLPLFDAAHGNTGTAALDDVGLMAAENAMRLQTAFGNQFERLGGANMPVTLAVPTALRRMALDLTGSPVVVNATGDGTLPNPYAGRYQVVVVDDWTDANNWFVFADPANVPILEIGFLGGREEPELFVQDQPTAGSVFTADKITYKVRHIWGIGIIDHRGAYRQVVAG